jgi:hypothetical protein
MTDAQNKPLPPSTEPLPEPSGFGKVERLENSRTSVLSANLQKKTYRRPADLLMHPDFEPLRLTARV